MSTWPEEGLTQRALRCAEEHFFFLPPRFSASSALNAFFACRPGVPLARDWYLQTGAVRPDGRGEDEPKPWLTSDHPGARLFRKCARCHSLDANRRKRSESHFADLLGRRAGAVPGYNDPDALRKADFTWTGEALGRLFFQGPDMFMPGTKMAVQRITDSMRLDELVDDRRRTTAAARNRRPE